MKRRIQLQEMVPAEIAIFNAMQEVEKVGADPRLTEVTMLLDKAKEILGDYIDEQLEKANEEIKKKFEGPDEIDKIISSMRDISPEKLREPMTI